MSKNHDTDHDRAQHALDQTVNNPDWRQTWARGIEHHAHPTAGEHATEQRHHNGRDGRSGARS